MSSPEDSLARALDVFEKLSQDSRYGEPYSHNLAAGLALLAEGLLAKIRIMESRLKAIEDALRRS